MHRSFARWVRAGKSRTSDPTVSACSRASPFANNEQACVYFVYRVNFWRYFCDAHRESRERDRALFALFLGFVAVTCVDRWDEMSLVRFSDGPESRPARAGDAPAHTAARGGQASSLDPSRASSAVCRLHSCSSVDHDLILIPPCSSSTPTRIHATRCVFSPNSPRRGAGRARLTNRLTENA